MDELYSSCRICLAVEANIPIFLNETNHEYDLLQKLNLCLGEEIKDIPGYPRHICGNCYTTVNATVCFINNYKQSCQVLKETLTALGQNENIKLEDKVKVEPDSEIFFIYDEGDFEEYKTEKIVKPESKIIFSDSNQLEQLIKPFLKKEINGSKKSEGNIGDSNQIKQLIKPFLKKDEKEIKPSKKSKGKIETTEVKNKKNKKASKKCEKKNVNFSYETIASGILEGDFVFFGDKWGVEPIKKLSEKDKTNSVETCKSNGIVPDKKEIKSVPRGNTPVKLGLCEFCGNMYRNQDRLKHHITQSHLEVPVTCQICSKIIKNSRGLRVHMKVRHEKKDFTCSVCGISFAHQYRLKQHQFRKHSNEYVKKKYECKICGKQYTSQTSLLIHTRSVHTGERPAVCDVCGASFYFKAYLTEHMRLHTGETPYKCPVCDRGYAQKCNLKSHIKHRHKLSQLSSNQLKTIPQRFLRFMKP